MSERPLEIPDAERDILACLARLGEATVSQLRDELAKVRPMQASSVLTLLNRLEARRLVAKRKADRGKAFVFSPTAASTRAWTQMTRKFFRQAFGGDIVAFMASFFETAKPTAAEIDRLQKLLDDIRSASAKKGE